jgi:subtilisin family serine protease
MSTMSRHVSQTGYGRTTGTSDATAIIAGAAALVRSKFPGLSAAEVVHRLTATADDNGPPGRDEEFGYGIVNPVKALTADVAPLPASTPTANRTGPTTPETSTTTRLLIIAGGIGLAALLSAGLVLALRRRA